MTNESQQNTRITSDEISLKDLFIKIQKWWHYLLSKSSLIIIFSTLGGALGFTYAHLQKPIYTATTTFVLQDEKMSGGGLGSLAGLASMAGVDLGGGGSIFQGDNISELYKSRKMLQQTLLAEIEVNGIKQSLLERYIEFNKLKENWQEKPVLLKLRFVADDLQDGIPTFKPDRSRDSLLTIFIADISKNYLTVAKPDKKSGIIQVNVKANDELFAKIFNQTIVRNVNNYYLQTSIKKSSQNVRIMQQKADSVRAVMNGAIYTAVSVSDATPNLNPTRQVQRIAPSQKAQFSAETNKTILSALVQSLEMSKLSLMKETPLLEIIDEPVLPLNKEKLGRAKGIILGGVLFAFVTVVFLSIRRIYKSIMVYS